MRWLPTAGEAVHETFESMTSMMQGRCRQGRANAEAKNSFVRVAASAGHEAVARVWLRLLSPVLLSAALLAGAGAAARLDAAEVVTGTPGVANNRATVNFRGVARFQKLHPQTNGVVQRPVPPGYPLRPPGDGGGAGALAAPAATGKAGAGAAGAGPGAAGADAPPPGTK